MIHSSVLESWQFWAVLSAVFAALTAITAKVGVEDMPSDVATLIRTVIILIALFSFVAVTRQLNFKLVDLSRRSLFFLMLSGIGAAASWIAYFRALKIGEVGQVAPIDKLSIVLVAVLGVLVLREKLSSLNWLGVGLAAIGAILVGYR